MSLKSRLHEGLSGLGIGLGCFLGARDRALDFFCEQRRAIQRALSTSPAQVISTHWQYAYSLAALADDRPNLITVRDAPLTIFRLQTSAYCGARLLVSQAVARRGRNFSISLPYVAAASRRKRVTWEPSRIIPNPLPPDLPAFPRNDTAQPSILGISDDSTWKNIPTPIEAFGLLLRTTPKARLGLEYAGLAPREHLPAKLDNIAGHVEYCSPLWRGEVAQKLASAWLLAHASIEESFGNTLVEAMDAGIPVVAASNCGAVPGALGNGRAGRLTNVRHASALTCGHVIERDEP